MVKMISAISAIHDMTRLTSSEQLTLLRVYYTFIFISFSLFALPLKAVRAATMDWAIPVQLWMDDNGGNRTLPPGTGPTRKSPSTTSVTR